MSDLLLHLGCGNVRQDGWVNCDYIATKATDMVFDLAQPWPFESNTVTAVYASHVLEHLDDPFTFFREAWRVMKPVGASMVVRVPYGGQSSAWSDLYHKRPWYPHTFAFLQPGYAEAVRNPQSNLWDACFGIHQVQVRASGRIMPLLKWPIVGRLVKRYIDIFPELLEEIYLHAWPLKDVQTTSRYQETHAANSVPLQYVIYDHDLRGKPVPASGQVEVVPL